MTCLARQRIPAFGRGSQLTLFLLILLFSAITSTSFAQPPRLGFSAPAQALRIPISAVSDSTSNEDYLDKRFLLLTSLTPQMGSPTSENALSRIVYFLKRGNGLYLMEDSAGQVPTSNLPAANILASFPIQKTSRNFVEVDFNRGMQRIFTSSGWHISDCCGTDVDHDAHFAGISAGHALLRDVQQDGDILTLKQLLQANTASDYGGRMFPTIEVAYSFIPYAPDPEFKPTENKNLALYAFFEAPPHYEIGTGSGRTITPITRWKLPPRGEYITYYISDNTPEIYRDAIRDGVLYWNKAFGRNVLRVRNAPPGMRAPSPTHNIIQWVEWDRSPYAYADANSDPFTGQIHNAQVYLTSAWGLNNQIIRQILRNMDSKSVIEEATALMQAAENPSSSASLESRLTPAALRSLKVAPSRSASFRDLILRRFPSARKCQFSAAASMKPVLERLLDLDVSNEDLVRISQDYIRWAVAHEIGHTLGERHNFAGQLDANITPARAQEIFDGYLSGRGSKRLKNSERLSSSVMPYPNFRDGILTGLSLPDLKEALPHDTYSIREGYELEPNTSPRVRSADRRIPFCSDGGLGEYIDCELFSSGRAPLVDHIGRIKSIFETLANSVVEPYILALTATHPQDRYEAESIVLYPSVRAMAFAEHFAASLFWFDRRAQSLQTEILHDSGAELQGDDRRRALLDFTNEQIQSAGGVEKALFWMLPLAPVGDSSSTGNPADGQGFMDISFENQLAALLTRYRTVGFRGDDGKIRKLTQGEFEEIQRKGTLYFQSFRQMVLNFVLIILENSKLDLEYNVNKRIVPGSPTAELQDLIGRFLGTILGSSDQRPEAQIVSTIRLDDGSNPKLAVQRPRYSHAIRMRAARILTSKMGNGPGWSMDSRRSLAEGILSRLRSSLSNMTMTLESVQRNAYKIDQPLRDWVLHELAILDVLGTAPGCEDLLDPEGKKAKTTAGAVPSSSGVSPGGRYASLFRTR